MFKTISIFLITLYFSVYSQSSEWIYKQMETGDVPVCFLEKSEFDYSLDNFLKVYVGGIYDIALKLCRAFDDKCIRYVYIKSGDSYYISNIPQAQYYLKISYGKGWAFFNSSIFCVEKFVDYVNYQKGEEILDYRIIKTDKGYQIPGYELKLDVRKGAGNEYEQSEISEEEFMK
ncbi:MAG: hypothetical protein N2510_06390 [Ignavibacteria bacterium]|nr:hypothetical protein [Ignavibacteria bacterium]